MWVLFFAYINATPTERLQHYEQLKKFYKGTVVFVTFMLLVSY